MNDQTVLRKRRARTLIRIAVFVVGALLALQAAPWRGTAKVLPCLSPFLSLTSALAARAASWTLLLAVPVLVVSLMRGRWFCAHLCPTGLAADTAAGLRRNVRGKHLHIPHLGRWLALFCLGGALIGYPVALWLDPLSLFNGFFGAMRRPAAWADLLPAAGFLVILLLSLRWPHAWCQGFCPLGATQQILGRLGRRLLRARVPSAAGGDPAFGRRSFLAALSGGIAALVVPRALGRNAQPIRPPGAAPEQSLTGLCVRCGNCMRSCPARVIRPDLGQSGVAGLLTPVIDQSDSYCWEYCNECTRACPTGAIRNLTLEQKRQTAIGLAEVTRTRCLAWSEGAYCMVCQEYCPYLAIRAEQHNGVNCPVVDPDMCRGCGTCHNQCPASPDKAINVHGIAQRKVKPLPRFERANDR